MTEQYMVKKYGKKVKDLMVKIDDYPTVGQDATIQEAMKVLRDSQKILPESSQPFRAVLVVDQQGNVVGKIGHLSFLRALEPKYDALFDTDKLSMAKLSPHFLESIMEKYHLWQSSEKNITEIVNTVKAKTIMKPVEENIDENATIGEAIHKIVMWQSLSLLVTKGGKVVGLLRLSDLYDDIETFALTDVSS